MKTANEIANIVSREIEKLDWSLQPLGLYEPIAYVLSMGGKRLRPMLTLMACNLYTEQIEPAIAPALGIEVFHNFTLLHDDIMDRANIRRGKPTVHKKWNDNTAILSGDVMQIASYQLIAKTPQEHLKAILDVFSSTAREICEGQQYDVDFEQRNEVNADDYLEMIRLKTAVLLGCALKTGAIIGGADEHDATNLYNFGIHIGLAFQLKDDLLDVYGKEETFGKKIGGDILCNKKTYLLIHALELAKGQDKLDIQSFLKKNYPDPQEKITLVTAMYNKLKVKKICEDKMMFYYNKAIANLDNIRVDSSKKQSLRNLAEKLLYRND
ncbi:MAG: isoprenyl synthetase [Porphyromonadaceae bacterium CG2_30_38_12]|nr:MAG: isoprenyl synthetase [Porphyromonadaceae bacterium CG2_30_38_12]